MIEMGFTAKTRPFVPNLASVLDPVIISKTQTHAEGKASAKRTLAGMAYLNRFSDPLKGILAAWGIQQWSPSFPNYKAALQSGDFQIPAALVPYYEASPSSTTNSNAEHGRLNTRSPEALTSVRTRTGQTVFEKIYLLQSRCLDHSGRAFPAYRFLLPEMIADDWLATVDWRHFQRDHVIHQPQVAVHCPRVRFEN